VKGPFGSPFEFLKMVPKDDEKVNKQLVVIVVNLYEGRLFFEQNPACSSERFNIGHFFVVRWKVGDYPFSKLTFTADPRKHNTTSFWVLLVKKSIGEKGAKAGGERQEGKGRSP
jgi:hypothetical protein